MIQFTTIINTPGYLPWAESNEEFDTCSQAWEYLIQVRTDQLDDPMPDEDHDKPDSALEEMIEHANEGSLGSVWGRTPGYNGDHDLGIAYSVVQTTI